MPVGKRFYDTGVFVPIMFVHLITLYSMLCRDEADQRTSLKLVDGMLPKLKPAEMLYLLPAVKDFISHPSPGCRDVMYNIFMWIYDNYKYD